MHSVVRLISGYKLLNRLYFDPTAEILDYFIDTKCCVLLCVIIIACSVSLANNKYEKHDNMSTHFELQINITFLVNFTFDDFVMILLKSKNSHLRFYCKLKTQSFTCCLVVVVFVVVVSLHDAIKRGITLTLTLK